MISIYLLYYVIKIQILCVNDCYWPQCSENVIVFFYTESVLDNFASFSILNFLAYTQVKGTGNKYKLKKINSWNFWNLKNISMFIHS